jgi:hypothetical protein
MNEQFERIRSILSDLRADYIRLCEPNIVNPNIPTTERDIVSEIYCRLKKALEGMDLYAHTEIKPIFLADPHKRNSKTTIDVAVLKNLPAQA